MHIGALISGEVPRDERARQRRVRGFLDALLLHSEADGVCIMLNHDALKARASLAAEGALFGIRRAEMEPLRAALSRDHEGVRFEWRSDFLGSDFALVWRRGPGQSEEPAATPCGPSRAAHHAVLRGPWGEDAGAEEVAWFWLEAGEAGLAREAI